MKRKFYPPTVVDRFGFWVGLGNLVLLVVGYAIGTPTKVQVAGAGAVIFSLIGVYVFQSRPDRTRSSDRGYAEALEMVESIRGQMSRLDKVLERQHGLAQEADRSLQQLEEQRRTLEPIVQTHRETVEAILSAHGRSVRRNSWKERIYGFLSGVACPSGKSA